MRDATIMPSAKPKPDLTRPDKLVETPIPPLPVVDGFSAEQASTEYSHYRTGLSNHRTGLSEHRTDLSEYRTDLSTHRTDLSTERTEMSMRRTGMSFQRTRMSAERTLMSVIRTALSLIGFGFTIYQAFEKLHDSGAALPAQAPRNFGIALVIIGIAVLVVGMINHLHFMRELRHTRDEMTGELLIHGQSSFPRSFTFVVAGLLLLLGFVAAVSMIFRIGPLG